MEELQIAEVIKIVKRRRKTLILFVFAPVILTAIYLFTVPPVYQATTKVLIESKPPKPLSTQDIWVQDSKDDQYLNTQYSLIKSRSLIKKLIIELNLLENKEFEDASPLINTKPLRNWVSSRLEDMGISQKRKLGNFEADPYSPLVNKILKRLKVVPVKESKIANIHFQGFSPPLIAKIANTLVDIFIREQMAYQEVLEADAHRWLSRKVDELTKRVSKSNLEMQSYVKNKDMVELDNKRNFANQQYRETLSKITSVRAKIFKLKSLIQQLRNVNLSPEKMFYSIPESIKDDAIRQLRKTYISEKIKFDKFSKTMEPSHPDLKNILRNLKAIEARIPLEIDSLLRSLISEFKATKEQEKELRLLQKRQKAEIMQLDVNIFQFNQIKQDAESSKKLQDQLMTRGKELEVYSSYYVPPIRLVDPAEVPTKIIQPRKGISIILALTFGLFGGLIIVFFMESIDDTIKNEEDVDLQLPFPLLGSVRWFKNDGYFSSSDKGKSTGTADFRNLRSRFLAMISEKPNKIFMVTSATPGQGKSTIVSNLAVSLSHVGKNVLVVDADLENPKVHEKFEIQKFPGLINILSTPKVWRKAIVKTKYPGLWVIPAGRQNLKFSYSPDVLFSTVLKSFLFGLRKNFDVILIKTAPTLTVSQASLVEKYCDGILFVVASGVSNKKLIQKAIAQLDSIPNEIIGKHYYRRKEDRNGILPGGGDGNEKYFRIVLNKVKECDETPYGEKQYNNPDYCEIA